MPLGVDHNWAIAYPTMNYDVRKPLMPLGVDHKGQAYIAKKLAECAKTFDAIRR